MIKNLPEKLKTLRTNYGLSQKQVADKLNLSPSIISSYETGERTPSTEILLSLSYLYNCSVDYLLGKSADKPQINLNVTGLTEAQIQALRALVDSMKNQ